MAQKSILISILTQKYDDGFVQPFGDGPINGNLIGKLAYISIINNAKIMSTSQHHILFLIMK